MKMKLQVYILASLLTLGSLVQQTALAQGHDQDYGALLKALPNSKLMLADGLRQAAKSGEVPISAKFELNDEGKLSLSVYTAEKGLNHDAEHNVLKELSGSPEATQWNPAVEVFKDVEHIARSAEQ
jgi:hypothetical protein